MGYDGLPSPGPNESAEITIEVRGAITPAAFKELKDKLKAYLNELAKLEAGKTLTWKRVSIKKYNK
jgi:hypothetical protein